MPEGKRIAMMKTNTHTKRPRLGRRGMTLLVAMVVLSGLSVIGMFAVNNAVIENRIAGNYRNASDALMWADASLEYGRSFVAQAAQHPQDHGDQFCDTPDAFLVYPEGTPREDAKAFVCIEHLKQASVSTGSDSAVSGGRVIHGRTHYYRITGICPYKDSNGNVLGQREVESVERILELVQ